MDVSKSVLTVITHASAELVMCLVKWKPVQILQIVDQEDLVQIKCPCLSLLCAKLECVMESEAECICLHTQV